MNFDNVSILVIDDEILNVKLLEHLLPSQGFQFTGLTDSKEALEFIKKNSYDIVLTDLVMPDVTGIDILKAVKETKNDTLVIIFTAFASLESTIEALRLGVYDYIQKPFNMREMLALLGRAVEKLRLQRENITLSKNINMMLSDITMLYDISNIIYQVNDIITIYDMVLDTLDVGMKIQKAAIILPDKSSNDFRINKSLGLSECFIKNFSFIKTDQINGKKLDIINTNIIPVQNSEITINGAPSISEQNCDTCILLPISYLGELLGFLGIFQIEKRGLLIDDELKLLKILVTQIAPILHFNNNDLRAEGNLLANAVNKYSGFIENTDADVIYSLIKLINIGDPSHSIELKELLKLLQEIILEEFGQSSKTTIINYDSIFVIIPSENLVSIDILCANIRRKIEDLHLNQINNPTVSIKYALYAQPKTALSIPDIIYELENMLFRNSTIINSISNDKAKIG